MKNYILIVTSDDMYQKFTLIDCETRSIVHQHSCGFCYEDEEEYEEIKKATCFTGGNYVRINISGDI